MEKKILTKLLKKLEKLPKEKWRKLRINEHIDDHTNRIYECSLNESFLIQISHEQYTLSPHEGCALRNNYNLHIYENGKELNSIQHHENEKIKELYRKLNEKIKPKVGKKQKINSFDKLEKIIDQF